MTSPLRILFVSLLLLVSFASGAKKPQGNMDTADKNFEKQLYEEALGEYLAVLEKSKGDEKLRALFRAAECEALLFRYAEAATRLLSAEVPESLEWKARFLLLKAELGREFVKQYGYGAPSDREEASTDVTRKTPAEWHAVIRASYDGVWALREKLEEIPLEGETYFIESAKADVAAVPTLWDFAVSRWGEYLTSEVPTDKDAKPAPGPFVDETYKGSYAPGTSAIEQAAAIFEDASRRSNGKRRLAVELWKLRRAMLYLDFPARFRADDDKKTTAEALVALRAFTLSFKQDRARAEAGHAVARVHSQREEFANAVEMCRTVEKQYAKENASHWCETLRTGIQTPELSLEAEPVAPGTGRLVSGLRFRARNVDTIYFRLVPTSPKELRELTPRNQREDWSPLRYLEETQLKAYLGKKAVKSWSLKTTPKAPHHRVEGDSGLENVSEAGLYVALASSDAAFPVSKSLIVGVPVNLTNLVLVGSGSDSGLSEGKETAPHYRLYALDGATGKPVRGAHVDGFLRVDWGPAARVGLDTDEQGVTRHELPTVKTVNSFSFDPLASYRDSYAFWASQLYFSTERTVPLSLFLESDRPIYRPGQKVKLKVTVLRRADVGGVASWRVYDGKEKIQLHVRDANYQDVSKQALVVNAMGSATHTFEVPTGRLLGGWSVHATLKENGRTHAGYLPFSVEEYKRPEFELTIQEAQGAWRYGKSAKVEGTAKYYFGGNVPDAPISYRVFQEAYIPWFCWWWRGVASERKEIASGKTTTDAEGKFSFELLPAPVDTADGSDKTVPSRYTVEVEGRDAGGRTLQASRQFSAGKQAFLFDVQPASGFATENEALSVDVRLVNLNDQPVAQKATWELFAVTGTAEIPDENKKGELSLDELYEKVPNGPSRATGTVSTSKDKPVAIALPALSAGVYRLVLRTNDPWGEAIEQSRLILSVGTRPSVLNLPVVTIPQHPKYEAGEMARVLLGSRALTDTTWVELWHGRHLRKTWRLKGGEQVLEFPITPEHRGGVTLRWFGVNKHRLFKGETALDVPWKDRLLSIQLKLAKTAKPGEKLSGEIGVTDSRGQAVTGEGVVRIFDRSLEYYAKQAAPWSASLWPKSPATYALWESLFDLSGSALSLDQKWLEALLGISSQRREREIYPPAFRLQRGRTYGHRSGRLGYSKVARMSAPMEAEASMADDMARNAAPEADQKKSFDAAPAASRPEGRRAKEESASAPPPPPPAARTNFSETALFEPQLRLKNGKASFSVTMPEQLTAWKVTSQAVTADAKVGSIEESLVTRKDLMVRVEIPRFFRERDESTIKAVVHNESAKPLSGTVKLQVSGKLALEVEKKFSVKPGALQAFSFPITAPEGTGHLDVRAIARAGNLVDAEERKLPLLPSRERLVASTFVALDGTGKQTIAFPEAAKQGELESASFQIDPQLALPILKSIPFLVQYPYECTEQVLNRAVPLSVVNALFKKHPSIAEAVKKLPRRKTVTPEWDREDPRRLVELMETPWQAIAKGREAEGGELVDLLDPARVARERARAMKTLLSYQLSDGGFPWFPGGRPDAYLTLYVLDGYRELRAFGAEFPEESAKRAFQHVMRVIPERLTEREGDVAMTLYGAYVLGTFLDLPWAQGARPMIQQWVDFADEHSRAMTALGKAYAAHVYWKLGNQEKGDAYLERAMDGAREDAVTGVYWTPEKISWLWYTDTVEKHAFFLRTLVEHRPKDPRIPGLAKWLLFNRKGNEWKSTKASAAAIYGLLDFMKERKALDTPEIFSFEWAGKRETLQLSATDALAKPLRWNRTPTELGKDRTDIKLDKKGPGIAFASLTTIFQTDTPQAAGQGTQMKLKRAFFLRVKENDGFVLKPLDAKSTVKVGDVVEVHLTLTTTSQFEYLHLKAPRAAGFESETLTSGWKWDQLSRYEEVRDSLNNFFIDWAPHGEYVLKYRLRAVTPGKYRFGSSVIQSMYAPEFNAYSEGMQLTVAD